MSDHMDCIRNAARNVFPTVSHDFFYLGNDMVWMMDEDMKTLVREAMGYQRKSG